MMSLTSGGSKSNRLAVRLAMDSAQDGVECYLDGIERGEYDPKVSVIGWLAAVLGVHPSAFFSRK